MLARAMQKTIKTKEAGRAKAAAIGPGIESSEKFDPGTRSNARRDTASKKRLIHDMALTRIFRLHAPELGIEPSGLLRSSRCVPSSTIRPSLSDDSVAILHGGQAMRDDDHGAALADGSHIGLDDALAFVIKRTCRLIENEDAGTGGERARNCYSLALAAGKIGAPLLDHGVIAKRHARDESSAPARRAAASQAGGAWRDRRARYFRGRCG